MIAAVNGAAIGGGFCLSLAADIRVASDTAYFRAAGINNGLTSTELGLSYLLPRAVGSSRAADIMLTGRDVDAAEAERIGLVSASSRARFCSTPATSWPSASSAGAGRGRAHQAHAVDLPRRLEPRDPHGRRGDGPAVRARHHPELRGGGAGAARQRPPVFKD